MYLGEINDSQAAAWRTTLDVFDEDAQRHRPMSLFPDDREVPVDALDSLRVKLSGLELRRPRAFGNCWLACQVWRELGLEDFWRRRLPDGREASDDDSCGSMPVSAGALALGPLANNGGATMTHALLEGSVAIDAAVDCTDWFGQPVTTDQRGVARPQGLGCDVGAFEREANTFTFCGFFAPVDNLPALNLLKAGSAVPVKFRLGGDHGLGILAAGYPVAPAAPCVPGAPTDSITEVVTAGNSRLSYDAATMTYTYVWKTEKTWANTCPELQVRLTDGTLEKARFQFSK